MVANTWLKVLYSVTLPLHLPNIIMAYQKSEIKLEGQVGDLVFYKQSNTYRARAKGGVDAKRFATDPKFERSRENSREFGRASAMSKQIRLALHEVLPLFHEGTMQTRLNSRLRQIILGDAINGRGDRGVQPESLPLFIGFSFNGGAAWKDVYYAPFEREFNAVKGKLTASFAEHWAPAVLSPPKKASGVRFTVAAIAVDTEAGMCYGVHEHSPVLHTAGHLPQQFFELDIEYPQLPVILLAGLAFFTEKGGYQIPIEQPLGNALDVVDVFVGT